MPPVLYKSNQTAFVIWCWDTLILFLLFAKKKKKISYNTRRVLFFFYPPTRNLPLRPRSQSRGTTFRLNINIWHIFQTLLYPWHPRYKVQLFALLQSRGLSINPPTPTPHHPPSSGNPAVGEDTQLAALCNDSTGESSCQHDRPGQRCLI